MANNRELSQFASLITVDDSTRVVGIDTSVGIGNTNPGAKLDVAGDIRLSTADAEIEFNTGGARLKGRTNALSIHTGGGLDSEASEQVRINTTGVGIGTTNPGSTLDVRSTGAQIRAQHSTNNQSVLLDSGASGPRISFGTNADNSFIEFGAYNNINNLDTKTRDLKIFSTSAPDAFILRQATGNIGIGTTNPATKLHVVGDARVSGVVTATTFIGALTGTATTATKLATARTFEITGDVVASAISFDGTGNVSLAATIQPNSVGLGTDTFGDYVRDITGTSNQITVTSGTGEGSTPTLSIPNQFTAPQDVTVTRDLQVNRNLNVNGNITIGGTSSVIFSQSLNIFDPDIVLGYRTDALGNDISNDNTANHGGVALASTEGTPLVNLFIAGIETNPATYKKIMWFKSGTFSGLGTDAWLSNYAVGIGSTQFPTGTRLAAGSVQFTENDLAVVRNINASGIVTASSFSGNASSATSVIGGIGSITQLQVTGISTFTNGPVFVGSATSTGTASQRLQVTGGAYFSSSVGIGTTNPTVPLQLSPNASISNVGIGITLPGTVGSAFTVAQFLHANSNASFLRIKATRNTAGSDWTSASTKLVNVTDVTEQGYIEYNPDGAIYGMAFGSGATEWARFLQNGNLGIGTTNPSSTLDVRGNVAVSGVTTTRHLNVIGFTTVVNQSITGVATVGSNLAVAGVTTTQHLSVSGVSTLGSALPFGNGTVSIGAGNTTLIVSGTTRVSGAATFDSTVNIAGNVGIVTTTGFISIGTSQTTGTVIIGGATQTGQITLGLSTVPQTLGIATGASSPGITKIINFGTGGDFLSLTQINVGPTNGIGTVLINSGTRLGIGTTPTSALDVIGGAKFTGVVTALNGPVIIGAATSTGTASQRLQVTGGGYVSGNLGVGVTNPSSRIDAYSPTSASTAIRATSGPSFSSTLFPGVISGLSTTGSGFPNFAASGIGATSGEIGVYSFYPNFANFPADLGPRRAVDLVGGFSTGTWGTEYFSINVGRNGAANDSSILTSEKVRITASGNVGIGTTNPVGQLQVSSGPVIIGAATSTGTASQPLQVTGGAYVSGNLGVGNTNPGATLNVVPTATSIAGLFSGTTSSDMVRITQLGSGNALVVEDSANPDSSPFVVNASGNIGIGTNNPTVALQLSPTADISNVGFGITLPGTVGSALTVAQFVYGNGNASRLRIKAARNATGSDWFSASTKLVNVTDVTEQGYIEYNPNGAIYGMAFGSGATEWARFLQNGNLGIGTTNPVGQLQVSSGPVIIGAATSTGTPGQVLQVAGINSSVYIGGNLGIGNTSTSYKFEVLGGSARFAQLAQGDVTITHSNLVSSIRGVTSVQLALGANNNEVIRINNSGNVGIGTTNPSDKLHVLGNNIRIDSASGSLNFWSGTGFYGGIGVLNAFGGSGTDIVLRADSGRSLIFQTGGANDRGRIDANGTFLVGSATSTGTSSQPLQVTGGAYVSGNLGIGRTNPQVKLEVLGGASLYSANTAAVASISASNTGVFDITSYFATGGAIRFVLADSGGTNTERARFDSSGNLGIGTTNPSSTLDVRGAISIGRTDFAGINSIRSVTDINSWEYFGISKSISAEETSPQDIFFKNDGTKMFIVGATGDDVNEYALSTAWNVSTAGFTTNFSVAAQDTVPVGLYFRPDGLNMYVSGQTGVAPLVASGDYVHQYTLGTAWDLSNVGVATVGWTTSFRVLEDSAPLGVYLKNDDGSKMYVVGSTNQRIYEYALGTAWNVSTAGLTTSILIGTGTTQNLPLTLTSPTGINFNASGTKMYISDSTRDVVARFDLLTAWDISTAVFYDNVYVGFQETNASGIFYQEDQSKAYLVGTTNDTVFQYNTDAPSLEFASSGISTRSSIILNNEARLNNRLYVTEDAHFSKSVLIKDSLTVENDIVITDDLTVSGGTITAGNVATILLGGNTTTAIDFATAQTTGTLILGGTAQTGTMTINRSTVTHTLNIDAGVSAASTIKTINFGTGGASGSFTQINIGPIAGVGTILVNTGTRLGIGSSTPTAALDVVGDTRVSGVATIGTLAVSGVTTTRHLNVIGFTTIVNESVTGVSTITILNVGAGGTIITTTSGGLVGIGTTNPPDKLTVSGKIQIQQDSSSNNRIVFRGQPASLFRWNIDNYNPENTFRIFREDDATSANGVVVVGINTAGNVGIGLTNPTAKLQLSGGTATTAPLKIISGTVLTTPEADAFEYDGRLLYHTQNDTTNGNTRALIPEIQFIRRINQVAITTTLSPGTSIFGAASRPALLSGNFYEIEAVLFLTKTTLGTVTFQASLSAGSFTQIALQSYQNSQNALNTSSAASPATIYTTSSLAAANDYNIILKGLVRTGQNTRFDLLAFNSAGSVGFNTNSYLKVSCVGTASSIGNFA